MTATTIKVDSDLRDRIAAYAKERGLTHASVIEMALEELIWRERMNRVRQDMAAPDDEYLSESRRLDATSKDGLRDW